MDLFREHASVPIFVLPGNHDPFTGPECIWLRKSLLNPPAHLHFLTHSGATDLGGTILLASPLQQKLSTIDPSLLLVELAGSVSADTIKIGVTHGALAIEGKHQPNDFPIALNGATRAGLDYLAVGHWHNWLAGIDGGRIVMPGTPEPDNFTNENSGNVALVEIAGPGQPPHVQPLPVATLNGGGRLNTADEAEDALVQRMRAMGREAMQEWAERRQVAVQPEWEPQLRRGGKKNSSG